MSNNIKQIQKFVKAGIEDVYTDNNFYAQSNIDVPQFNRGVLAGKKLAYEKVLDFISEMEKELNEWGKNVRTKTWRKFR